MNKYSLLDLPGEVWKPVPIHPYAQNYQVSNYGRVKTLAREVMRAGYTRPLCYPTKIMKYRSKEISFCMQNRPAYKVRIAKLVIEAFTDRKISNKDVVLYKDGDILNNALDNLIIIPKTKHTMLLGYNKKVRCIETGEIFNSITQAAKQFNCNVGNISKVVNKKHLTIKEKYFSKKKQATKELLHHCISKTCKGYHFEFVD